MRISFWCFALLSFLIIGTVDPSTRVEAEHEANFDETLYEDVLNKTAIYGNCWLSSISSLEENCLKETERIETSMEMCDCFLREFYDEDSFPNCTTTSCDTIGLETYTNLRKTFQEISEIFCETWILKGRPSLRPQRPGNDKWLTIQFAVSELYENVQKSVSSTINRSCIVVRETHQLIDDRLGEMFSIVYEIVQVRSSNLMERFHDTFNGVLPRWQKIPLIATTNIKEDCEHPPYDYVTDAVGGVAWIGSFVVYLFSINLFRMYANTKPFSKIDLLLSLIATVGYFFEKQIISYSLNNCPGTGLRANAIKFMKDHQMAFRLLCVVAYIILISAELLLLFFSSMFVRANNRRHMKNN